MTWALTEKGVCALGALCPGLRQFIREVDYKLGPLHQILEASVITNPACPSAAIVTSQILLCYLNLLFACLVFLPPCLLAGFISLPSIEDFPHAEEKIKGSYWDRIFQCLHGNPPSHSLDVWIPKAVPLTGCRQTVGI